jgi:hypothetical protein
VVERRTHRDRRFAIDGRLASWRIPLSDLVARAPNPGVATHEEGRRYVENLNRAAVKCFSPSLRGSRSD